MTRRIRTTKQARECRAVAEWNAAEDTSVMAEFDFSEVWNHEMNRERAQAWLAKRAQLKRDQVSK